MKTIRYHIFETNSSSSHSISISANTTGIYHTLPVDDNGAIHLNGGQFGWEWEKYNDALTKANYCAIFSFQDEKLSTMLLDLIKEHTGAKEIVLNFSTTDFNHIKYSYIDHQSDLREGGDALKAFESSQTLKDFIFNPNSWLYTGNDNEEEPPNFYDSPDTKYTHVLKIEGSNSDFLFTEKPNKEQLQEAVEKICSRSFDHLSYFGDPKFSIANDDPSIDGNRFSSYLRLDEGVIVLFKCKTREFKNNPSTIRFEILDTKEIKFEVVQIGIENVNS